MVAGVNLYIPDRVVEYIAANAELTKSGCWQWLGAVNEHGYGRVSWHDGLTTRRCYVHRAMWLSLVGDIAAGLELDHLCKNRRCCNCAHLEPVTHLVNMQRAIDGIRRGALKRVRTHCKYGHILDGDNLSIIATTGERRCKECVRTKARERYRRSTKSFDPNRSWSKHRVP
jgi:hypothetical protein